MRTQAVLILVTWALTVTAQSPIAIRPGLWESTAEMTMAGKPMAPIKATECITADDVKDAATFFTRDQDGCKVSNLKISTTKVTFTTTCDEGGERMTGTTEMTFTADTFSGVAPMKHSDGQVITMKTISKRVGECK